MAEASRNSNKPITTAAFLEQIANTSNKTEEPKKESPAAKSEILEPPPAPTTEKCSTDEMESLSDSDLQTLLQNFKDLSTDEQHKLITYLKKLEAREPDRVERLRKFVNLGGATATNPPAKMEDERSYMDKERESPFSHRQSSVNPSKDTKSIKDQGDFEEKMNKNDNNFQRIHFDSDEEDYSFEDVVKAASKNVKQKELEKEREIVEESMKFESMKEKEDIFSTNDSRQFEANFENRNVSSENLLNLRDTSGGNQNTNIIPNLNVTSAELAKTLNSLPLNISSLADIVGNVKNFGNKSIPQSLDFQPNMAQNRCYDRNQSPIDQGFIKRNELPFNKPQNAQQYNPRSNFNPEPPSRSGMQDSLKNPPFGGGSNFNPNYRSQQNVSYPIDVNKLGYQNYTKGSNDQSQVGNAQNKFGGIQNRFGGNNERKGEWLGNNPRPGGNFNSNTNNRYGNRSSDNNNRW